ncbi:MAG: hypothetical protein HY897_07925 [Deltaproteobacteria bacterium]|nr:hypothetical protein [Deltaproteobacteria bacterium]
MTPGGGRPIPGELLVRPVPICGMALLLLNDHFLKHACPGVVTGKLSDLAGLLFFPLLLQALFEFARAAAGKFDGHSRRELIAVVLLTAAVFATVKTWTPANELYRVAWGAMQWPFRAAAAAIRGEAVSGIRTVVLVRDPTDLAALPALLATYWSGLRAIRPARNG